MKQKTIDFIRMAKGKTYSSTTSKSKKTKDGGKSYIIKKGNLIYRDKYFGNIIDCGQERVYEKEKVIWMMAYRGGMCPGKESMDKEAFNFLKKCISKMPKNFPARGPKKFKEGKWVYENTWRGNMKDFVGEENIYFNKKKICFRNYIGGLVKNKK